MYDFLTSKFGSTLVIVLFGGSIAWMGIRDVQRMYRNVRYPGNIRENPMVRYLHGDVGIRKRSAERSVEAAQARRTRHEEWDGMKGYMKSLLP